MNATIRLAAPLVAALAIAACNGGSAGMPSTGQAPQSGSFPQAKADRAKPVCPDMGPGTMHCMVEFIQSAISPDVAGLGPIDFQTRYGLTSKLGRGAGQIVAIVDAFDNPNVSSDLSTYRSNFGLGTANFTKYNQNGQTSGFPGSNQNWGLEIDLDVQMVSAVCPKCTIFLVEANSNSTSDLLAAETTAATLGAHVISNSWGGGGGISTGPFSAKGVVYLASAGDGGYGTQAPADLANVVSVGGTQLIKQGSNYMETTWRGTGSGCANGITKPSWQHDSGCSARMMNDVAAVATGVAMYDSFGYGGWTEVQGTSISSPMLGGIFGLAQNASSQTAGKKFWSLKGKKRKKALWDITTGSNGTCAGQPSYYCTAGKGYDGPTGWGTPKGISAF